MSTMTATTARNAATRAEFLDRTTALAAAPVTSEWASNVVALGESYWVEYGLNTHQRDTIVTALAEAAASACADQANQARADLQVAASLARQF